MFIQNFISPKTTSENCDSISILIVEIVDNGRKLNLEMDAEDFDELINSPDLELTIDILTELKKQILSKKEIRNLGLQERGRGIMTVAKLTERLH